MTVLADATTLPAARREEAIREAAGSATAPVMVAFPGAPQDVEYRLEAWQLGRACLIRSVTSGIHLARTARLVRQNPAEIVSVGFQRRGSGRLVQNSCTRLQRPGDLSVVDFTLPWETGLGERCDRTAVVFEYTELGLPVDLVRRAASLVSSPVHDLFRAHLAGLARDAGQVSDSRHAAMLGRATVDLARALVASAGRDEPGANDAWHETQLARVTAYVRQHLTDPDLCAEKIALVHSISVRQLYKLWSGHDASLGHWIMIQRLEGARRDLAATTSSRTTVAAIAARWGFADSAHFSRRFRAAYGLSPREWRRLNRAG